MTCMAFDRSKRCLYTGGEEGLVKLWNFSSGQQLRTFTMRQPAEIRSLLWAKEGPNSFVVGLAWDRRIYVWPDSRKQIVEPQYETSAGNGASSRRYRLFDNTQVPSQAYNPEPDRRKVKKGDFTTANKRISNTNQQQGYLDSPSSLQTGEGLLPT
eukprot:g27241.t1